MPDQRPPPTAETTLELAAGPIRRRLLQIALLLAALSLGARMLQPWIHGLARLVDLNVERSFPTWYSSLGLAVSSFLLGAIALILLRTNRRAYIHHWIFLSAIFAAMSADEIVGVHETMNRATRQFGEFSAFLGFGWVVPAAAGLAALGLAYLNFLASLQTRSRNQFLAAGVVYVFGAIGIEMVGAKAAATYTRDSMAYILCYNLEELLELSGIALFNAALIEHIARLLAPGGLRLRFRED